MKVKTNMKAGFMGSIVLLIVAALTAPLHTHAISWCHDYVYYVITGGTDANHLGPQMLKAELRKKGYSPIKTLTPANENSFNVEDGDVLFFGTDDAHSAYVGRFECGKISHFLQNTRGFDGKPHYGEQYTIKEVLAAERLGATPTDRAFDFNFNTPLLRRKSTLQEIRGFTRQLPPFTPFKDVPVQVWRHGGQVMLDWAAHDQGGVAGQTRFGPITEGSFVQDADSTWEANNQGWRLSSALINFNQVRTVELFLATNEANGSALVSFSDDDVWSGWKSAY